jgi:Uma2 family endonuclease
MLAGIMTLLEQPLYENPALERVVLTGIDWKEYVQIIDRWERAGRRVRSSYDSGTLEVVVPGPDHERIKTAIARLFEAWADESEVLIDGLGSMTSRRKAKAKGLEPDECYYIARPKLRRAVQKMDNGMLPPDLAIEVDVSTNSVDRFAIYAKLGVREVWRWHLDSVELYELADDKYVRAKSSKLLPEFPFAAFSRFLRKAMNPQQGEQSRAVAALRAWMRKNGLSKE